jgi:FMN phosphatase YigB (HAD superfamily)
MAPSPHADAAAPSPPLSARSLHPRGPGPHGRPVFTHVLLDLDDTLYRDERVAILVRAHIVDYVERELKLERSKAEQLTVDLWKAHGTTMAGLAHEGHPLDPDHWHRHVHAPLPYEELLTRDDRLVAMLRKMTRVQKHVFTNADKAHMDECLRRLGAAQAVVVGAGGGGSGSGDGVAWDGEGYYFERVQELGARRGLVPDAAHPRAGHRGKGFLAKPDPALFRLVAEDCGAASPSTVVFVDDSVRNVAAARSVGMFTVLVGRGRHERVAGADICIAQVLELPEVLPELFSGEGEGEEGECAAGLAAAPVAVRVVAG